MDSPPGADVQNGLSIRPPPHCWPGYTNANKFVADGQLTVDGTTHEMMAAAAILTAFTRWCHVSVTRWLSG